MTVLFYILLGLTTLSFIHLGFSYMHNKELVDLRDSINALKIDSNGLKKQLFSLHDVTDRELMKMKLWVDSKLADLESTKASNIVIENFVETLDYVKTGATSIDLPDEDSPLFKE